MGQLAGGGAVFSVSVERVSGYSLTESRQDRAEPCTVGIPLFSDGEPVGSATPVPRSLQ